jgi:DNA-binding NtrC family response regulator
MSEQSLLDGKRILTVDDEPDVLESLEELLPMCEVVKVSNFNKAKELLESQYFDMAILDIMGVDGYELLEIAREKKVIAVMLTAHALSVDDTVKSYREGAASYVPKDEMANIAAFLEDILEAKEKGQNFWWRWLDRLGTYYEKKFGADWQNKDEEFWKDFRNRINW